MRLKRAAWVTGGALAVALLAIAWGFARHARQKALREQALRERYVSYDGDGARAIEPNLAVGPTGEVVVAWMHVPAGTRRGDGDEPPAADGIGVRVGASPERLAPIDIVRSPDGRFAADPAIAALPGGAMVLTWLGFRADVAGGGEAYDMGVYAARKEPGAARFGAPSVVTGGSARREYDRPWSAVTSTGRVVVVYRSAEAGDGGLTVATSADGVRWRERVLFSSFGFAGGLATACAAKSTGNVYIAYFDPLRGILARTSSDDGESFSDESIAVSAEGEEVALEAPSCVAERDEVVVAYGVGARPVDTGSSAPLARVVLARSRDAGRSFDARAAVREDGRVLLHPRVAMLAGDALGVVTYAAPAAGTGSGELRAYRVAFGQDARGEVLRGDLRVAPRRDDPAWAGDYLGFAVHDGRGYVTYIDSASGSPQVALLAAPMP